MAIIRAQWTQWSATGRPEDAIMNTYHFDEHAATPDRDNIRDMLRDFYDDLATWLSDDAITRDYELKLYNLDDTPPRAPVATYTGQIAALSTTGATAPQVAIVMSWQAEKVSGLSQAKRRNRVYLGGWTSTSIAGTGLVNPSTFTAIQTAAQNLYDAADASISYSWVVYSPTDEEAHTIHDGWIDDSIDIQRRRKHDATSRLTFG